MVRSVGVQAGHSDSRPRRDKRFTDYTHIQRYTFTKRIESIGIRIWRMIDLGNQMEKKQSKKEKIDENKRKFLETVVSVSSCGYRCDEVSGDDMFIKV
ncbi:hypothetical protein V1478_005599 [Vespula squamosa]|uniref:Uncharacterized protein n=1 Tax=Vespula squamosa TaxID=30214 RepID=A0ABD2BAI2_VESSQ